MGLAVLNSKMTAQTAGSAAKMSTCRAVMSASAFGSAVPSPRPVRKRSGSSVCSDCAEAHRMVKRPIATVEATMTRFRPVRSARGAQCKAAESRANPASANARYCSGPSARSSIKLATVTGAFAKVRSLAGCGYRCSRHDSCCWGARHQPNGGSRPVKAGVWWRSPEPDPENKRTRVKRA